MSRATSVADFFDAKVISLISHPTLYDSCGYALVAIRKVYSWFCILLIINLLSKSYRRLSLCWHSLIVDGLNDWLSIVLYCTRGPQQDHQTKHIRRSFLLICNNVKSAHIGARSCWFEKVCTFKTMLAISPCFSISFAVLLSQADFASYYLYAVSISLISCNKAILSFVHNRLISRKTGL